MGEAAVKLPRRAVLAGLAGIPFAAHLPMAVRPAHAQAELESVTLTISGGRTVSGVVAAPAAVPRNREGSVSSSSISTGVPSGPGMTSTRA